MSWPNIIDIPANSKIVSQNLRKPEPGRKCQIVEYLLSINPVNLYHCKQIHIYLSFLSLRSALVLVIVPCSSSNIWIQAFRIKINPEKRCFHIYTSYIN